jgi:enamine deaminase RidA (YjgF/YER057c/UK114 family)
MTLKPAGTPLDHVVKTQVLRTDLAKFGGFDEAWRQYFATPPPRTTVETAGPLVLGTVVDSLLAAKP